MSNLLWKSLVVSPAVLGASLLVSAAAMAAPSVASKEVATVEVSTVETQFDTQEVSTQKVEIPESSAAIEVPQSLQKGLEKTPQVSAEKSLEQSLEKVPTSSTILAQTQNPTNSGEVLDQVNRYSNEGKNNNNANQGQVTSVSQFSDVQPTDWAFQALQSLVERYGCIAGYPNGTFRGNRAMTRYEFAAGLNACLDRVNELIATATADLVRKEDLATLQRLQEEFSAELATLRGRVDALEARTAELEANQFSTTTKLVGEAIFALSDAFGDRVDSRNNTVFQNRVRLDLQTSFTGRDVLHTRLATGNARRFDLGNGVPGASSGSGEGNQTFNITGDGSNTNDVYLDWLAYYFPVGPAQVYVAATGGIHSDYAATNNPYFEDFDGGNGALSTFASSSPIFRIGGGAGASVSIPFTPNVGPIKGSSITVGYLGSEGPNPAPGAGLFNGNYAALGQVNFSLGGSIALAATYVNSYHGGGGNSLFDAGGLMGQDGLGQNNGVVGTRAANVLTSSAETNSYGLSAAFRPSKNLSVSGFVSYHDVGQRGNNNDFEAWSWGAGLALPDFGKKGNVLGIFGGAQPYAIGRRDIVAGRETPFHVEGFYKYRLNDNISITPGVIWLMNPDQERNAPDAIIGTLRTTFTF
jgi:Carbohydrate-selective porin, OprB family/S-layer homology domain